MKLTIKVNDMLQITLCSPIIENPVDLKTAQFELNDEVRNREVAAYHIEHGMSFKLLGKEAYLVDRGDSRTLALLDGADVSYFCWYKEYKNREYSNIEQLIVWQSPTLKGVARKMLDWFLENYDYLELSDTQYPRGVEMYKKYVYANLDKYIYLNNNYRYTRITTKEQFDGLLSKIWGKTTRHKNVRLLFSNKELDFV